jgi:hypothetical protein
MISMRSKVRLHCVCSILRCILTSRSSVPLLPLCVVDLLRPAGACVFFTHLVLVLTVIVMAIYVFHYPNPVLGTVDAYKFNCECSVEARARRR